MAERGLLGITKDAPFTLHHLGAISGTWDKNQNQTPTITGVKTKYLYTSQYHTDTPWGLTTATKNQGTSCFASTPGTKTRLSSNGSQTIGLVKGDCRARLPESGAGNLKRRPRICMFNKLRVVLTLLVQGPERTIAVKGWLLG